MQDMEIEQRLLKVMGQVFKLAPEAIPSHASRDDLAQWDSLKHLNLMLALEDSFGVEFTDREIADIRSRMELAAALRAKSC